MPASRHPVFMPMVGTTWVPESEDGICTTCSSCPTLGPRWMHILVCPCRATLASSTRQDALRIFCWLAARTIGQTTVKHLVVDVERVGKKKQTQLAQTPSFIAPPRCRHARSCGARHRHEAAGTSTPTQARPAVRRRDSPGPTDADPDAAPRQPTRAWIFCDPAVLDNFARHWAPRCELILRPLLPSHLFLPATSCDFLSSSHPSTIPFFPSSNNQTRRQNVDRADVSAPCALALCPSITPPPLDPQLPSATPRRGARPRTARLTPAQLHCHQARRCPARTRWPHHLPLRAAWVQACRHQAHHPRQGAPRGPLYDAYPLRRTGRPC